MYKSFFGLNANPFALNPDPRFLFLTDQIREALACLTYGVHTRKGFMLLTGEVGTGKTTLINQFLKSLRNERVATAFIFNSRLDETQFFDFMLADFGIDCASTMKSKVLIRLNQWLLERHQNGETAVLIIDEAQHLSDDVLEEIRLLTNLETSTEKLLQIVLSGQPELDAKLARPELRQLKQRIALRSRTRPFSVAETEGYIARRLELAGATASIFTPEAVAEIDGFAHGIPRIINLICEHCLIYAFVEEQKTVSAQHVRSAARDLDLEEKPVEITETTPKRQERWDVSQFIKLLSDLAQKTHVDELSANGTVKRES